MPLMRPPKGAQGVKYNGSPVEDGQAVNVLPQDEAAHLAEGWSLVADSTLPPAAVADFDGED